MSERTGQAALSFRVLARALTAVVGTLVLGACGGTSKPWSVSARVLHANQRIAGGGWSVQLRGMPRHSATLSISSQPPGETVWGPDLKSLKRAGRDGWDPGAGPS